MFTVFQQATLYIRLAFFKDPIKSALYFMHVPLASIS